MEPEPVSPLSEATFFILLSLSKADRHGYAILQEVRALSEGRIVFSTGTLYGALKRLLEQGWITRLEDDHAGGDRRGRKVYRLSRRGTQMMKHEIARLEELLSAAKLSLAEGLL